MGVYLFLKFLEIVFSISGFPIPYFHVGLIFAFGYLWIAITQFWAYGGLLCYFYGVISRDANGLADKLFVSTSKA